jgi:hypothetical protein
VVADVHREMALVVVPRKWKSVNGHDNDARSNDSLVIEAAVGSTQPYHGPKEETGIKKKKVREVRAAEKTATPAVAPPNHRCWSRQRKGRNVIPPN